MGKIIHIGDGKFEMIMEDGSKKQIGPSMRGMIRYTYFEDYTLPPINWEIEHDDLLKDYHEKIFQDIKDGKFILDNSKYIKRDKIMINDII